MGSIFPALNLRALLVLACLSSIACQPAARTAVQTCQPLGYDKAELLELKAENFAIDNPQRRANFAAGLLECLGDPDPELRDGIAYAAFFTMLRAGQLSPLTQRDLRIALLGELNRPASGDPGFRRPFAALVLSELVRADRVEPVFTDEQRAEIVSSAVAYMRGIDDYRGYDEAEGWRHAVAHTADLMLQLVLNPAVSAAQRLAIRDAIGTQVAPPGEHFFVYGEPRRLARPILVMAERGDFTEQDWTDWLMTLASPAPFRAWEDTWSSQAGLAKLHNSRAFAQAIYVNVAASKVAAFDRLGPGTLALLVALP